MTAMRKALHDAGMLSTEERLERAIQLALDHPGNPVTKKNMFFDAVRADAEVMWLAFARVRVTVLQEILADAAQKRRAQKAQEIGGGQIYDEGQGLYAPSGAITTRGLEGEVYPPKRTDKALTLGATILAERSNEVQAETRRQKAQVAFLEQAANRVKIAHLTLLDTVKIDGRPIGDFNAGEASAWAIKTGQQSKFVQLLVTGLQPEMVIRKHVTAEDAERYMMQARSLVHA